MLSFYLPPRFAAIGTNRDLSFFFELFFFARTEPRRRTQRLAVVEERQDRARAGKAYTPATSDRSTTVTGLPSTPSRKAMRQPQARRACVKPFSMLICIIPRDAGRLG